VVICCASDLVVTKTSCLLDWKLYVHWEKPPKDNGKSSSSRGGDDIDQYDPLFLHSNDISDVFMGQVFSKNAKSGSALSEYYHWFNALWRQYDFLVNLAYCICENSKLKKHNQLLKLMQLLMGLDEVYAP
ncbi:hypothetical protein Tco_1180995, partial [Tanacetum coccineum]